MTQHFKYELTTEGSGVFLQCDPSELDLPTSPAFTVFYVVEVWSVYTKPIGDSDA